MFMIVGLQRTLSVKRMVSSPVLEKAYPPYPNQSWLLHQCYAQCLAISFGVLMLETNSMSELPIMTDCGLYDVRRKSINYYIHSLHDCHTGPCVHPSPYPHCKSLAVHDYLFSTCGIVASSLFVNSE